MSEQTWAYIYDELGNIVQIVYYTGKTRTSSLYIERNSSSDVKHMTVRPVGTGRRTTRRPQ